MPLSSGIRRATLNVFVDVVIVELLIVVRVRIVGKRGIGVTIEMGLLLQFWTPLVLWLLMTNSFS